MRVSRILAEKYGFSVRLAKNYIKDGKVTLDGRPVNKDIDTDSPDAGLLAETKRPSDDPAKYILRKFDNLVFFDKPAFMHTEIQRPDDPLTMQDILTEFSADFAFISRLDFTTDGVICAVRKGFFVFETKKIYLAWVQGRVEEPFEMSYRIDADKKKKVKVTDMAGGYKTLFTPVRYKDDATLVQAEMETAARHQLRAYLAHAGHPIIGDTLYGGRDFDRILLHCRETYVNRFPGISAFTAKFENSI
jgi:23S rRNA-/tRNA-specific pseudouridylate synthase